MENEYQYLFPFEQIKKGSRVIIYGAGFLGQQYIQQIELTKYCEIVAIVDKNYSEYLGKVEKVCPPSDIPKYDYDYIVISMRTKNNLSEIYRVLEDIKVDNKKIVYLGERDNSIVNKRGERIIPDSIKLADQRGDKSIAVSLMGGLGDFIIQKKVIANIVNLEPSANIDIYCSHSSNFVRLLYNEYPQILVMSNLGSRFELLNKKYSLALTIQDAGIIKIINNKLQQSAFSMLMKEKINKLQNLTEKEYYFKIGNPIGGMIKQRLYKKLNCYTGFSYDGVFMIKNRSVEIVLPPESLGVFQSLQLGKYITINAGNGCCEDGRKIAKSWPNEYFTKLVNLFHQKYPAISIIQLGDKNATKIKGTIPIFGKDFSLVGQILKHSLLHVDIEGGLVHFATQLKTKCVVLFGPTSKEYYGYPQNINIQAGDCHDCYGLYPDVNQCARNLEQPECMYKITPEMVMEKVDEYMKNNDEKDYVKFRIYIAGLGLEKPLIVKFKNNTDIITSIKITQDKKNNGIFEIKCYINSTARIESENDERIRYACENVIGNIALCTKASVGVPEYIESSFAGITKYQADLKGCLTVATKKEELDKIEEDLCLNHKLDEWELLYRATMTFNDDVTRFILLYAIIQGVLESNGHHAKQEDVDNFIRTKCNEKGKKHYLGLDTKDKTIYTLLRNAIGHAKPGNSIPTICDEIKEKVPKLAEIALWAIQKSIFENTRMC